MAEEAGMTEVDIVVSRRGVEKIMTSDQVDAIVKRAASGDRGCLPDVRALLADPECGADFRTGGGSSAEWLRQSLIKSSAGKNVLTRECITQELDRVRRELEGPNPTPIERLLAERASLCWHIVNQYENTYANASGWNISQADLQHRKIDKAHARFLTAVRTLAQVRKLALPTLQVNIARNQVNVAEAGRE
jgi:hypothetical protein